nr:HepT-like ribonuclease domain-containing protein [Algoriphagus terrigena]
MRNRISHAYDSIEDELIWGIIQRDIPSLKKEIQRIRLQ